MKVTRDEAREIFAEELMKHWPDVTRDEARKWFEDSLWGTGIGPKARWSDFAARDLARECADQFGEQAA